MIASTDMEERGRRIGRAMARPAKSSGIRHLVFLSSLGAFDALPHGGDPRHRGGADANVLQA
ncbi:MAG TPA: hypothetical protein VNA04_13410 [Thermoanaerobaculia bacterium]|nr:hypothetical protein [Thermoanaerobaculia bacterium]